MRQVARVHHHAFPDSALTHLGVEAVRRYYLWQLEGPHDAVCLGAWQGETLIGFCFAGTFRGALAGFLQRNRPFLLRRVLARPWLLWNPLFRDRIALALRVLARRAREKLTGMKPPVAPQNEENAAPDAPRFGILSIAVEPKTQRSGAGRALMEACENEARQRGAARLNLSVHPSNAPAVGFYERLGWTRENGADGVWHGTMHKSLETKP